MQTAITPHDPLPEKKKVTSHHQMKLHFQEATKSDCPQCQYKFTVPVLLKRMDFFSTLWVTIAIIIKVIKTLLLKFLFIIMYTQKANGPL